MLTGIILTIWIMCAVLSMLMWLSLIRWTFGRKVNTEEKVLVGSMMLMGPLGLFVSSIIFLITRPISGSVKEMNSGF